MGKSQKNYMSIKSKLMAAVAMLLVASFMVVSSTYAWFTLSTAPEVTGIKTTIGANGSLEMALLVYDGTDPLITDKNIALSKISSTIGSSAFAPAAQKVVSNRTWGNLVDLDDPSYGLDKITLLPARLNVTGDGSDAAPYTLAASMLKTPVYGADGRVTELEANAVSGTFAGDVATSNNYTGVRVLGTASGMSAQQLARRNALATYSTQLALAKTKASNSLQNSIGSKLASIAAQHATATDGDTNVYNIECIEDMVNLLNESNEAVGAAIKAYFDALLAYGYKDKTEDEYKAAKLVFDSASLADLMSGKINVNGTDFTFPTDLVNDNVKAAYAIYSKNKGILNAATTAMTAEGVDLEKVNWTTISNILINTGLLKMDNITINDFSLDEVKANITKVFLSGDGINVQMPYGSGVHANLAQAVGSNYNSSVQISGVSYGGVTIKEEDNVTANMTTIITKGAADLVVDPAPAWETFIGKDKFVDMKATSIPDATGTQGADASQKITDYYGYALDFAFRTNATNSNLMLQTTPIDRIYSEGGVAETMGHGSTMTFTSTDPAVFSEADVENLMKAIRLVFTDGTGKIVAIGAIDQTAGATVSSGEVTGNIYLYNYTITNEVLTLGDKIVTADAREGQTKLMPLDQNKATALSVHVYLDGDIVDNTMVANAASSMSGKLNLQFSSSAKLVPMQYTPLTNQTATENNTPAQGGEQGGN